MLDLSLQDIGGKLAKRTFQISIPIKDPTATSSAITKKASPVLLGPNGIGVHLTLPSLLNRILSMELHSVGGARRGSMVAIFGWGRI